MYINPFFYVSVDKNGAASIKKVVNQVGKEPVRIVSGSVIEIVSPEANRSFFTTTKSAAHLEPLSPEAIDLGSKRLHNPFTANDLTALLDGDGASAYRILAVWKQKDWIKTGGFQQYLKTDKFGK